MLRLKEMEHGSERRAKVVARDIAGLREEGRHEREKKMNQWEEKEVGRIYLHVVDFSFYMGIFI